MAVAKRVYLLTASNRRRGAEVFAERLRMGLRERGYDVDAESLSSGGAGPTVDIQPLYADAPTHLGRFDLGVFRALRKRISTSRPDLIVAMGGSTLRYGVLAKDTARLLYVAIGEPDYWLRSGFHRWLNRTLLRRCDRIVAVSNATAKQLQRLEPGLADRVTVGWTGVPEALFGLVREARPEGPLRVVMIGSLSSEKDPMLGLRAVAAVDDCQVRFLGSGPLQQDLEAEAAGLGVGDRTSFLGSVDSVADHLRWADVLLLTSKTEGLPGVVLEAGAAGVPAIATDVGGVREAVVDGESGLVVERSEEAVGAALARLAGDRSLVDSMGSAARKHVRESFRMADCVDRYVRAVEEVLV